MRSVSAVLAGFRLRYCPLIFLVHYCSKFFLALVYPSIPSVLCLRFVCTRWRWCWGGIAHPLAVAGACEAPDAGNGCHLPARQLRQRVGSSGVPGGLRTRVS